ncbi:Uncharacterised protein [uncultured archaeon]|nr:Uncharacterised protein [uncultured archaeon]
MTVDPALIISTLALVFTILSFWWMNWRMGHLMVSGPRSYAAKGSIEERLILRFPFIFFNDGPMPIIVQNLRLIFVDEKDARPLGFTATVKKIKTGENQDRDLATQFPVHGREALLLICEFQRIPGGMLFEAKKYHMELQALLGKSQKWKGILNFTVNVSETSIKSINQVFISYDNMIEE